MDEGKVEGEEVSFSKDLVDEKERFTEEEHKSVYQQILTMSISQKIQLALKGNKEARGILVKDPNKLVCSAVIKSPKIIESEAVGYAKSRNVSDEVLRLIAMNKEWMRSHEMVLALVNNPRTPIAISMQLMNRLRDKELADLAKSKNVPAALSTAARRLVVQKSQKGQKH
jgi:hypothetical protein